MKQSFMVLAILAVTFGNGAVVNAEFHSTSAANAPPMVAVATVMAYTGTTTINAGLEERCARVRHLRGDRLQAGKTPRSRRQVGRLPVGAGLGRH